MALLKVPSIIGFLEFKLKVFPLQAVKSPAGFAGIAGKKSTTIESVNWQPLGKVIKTL